MNGQKRLTKTPKNWSERKFGKGGEKEKGLEEDFEGCYNVKRIQKRFCVQKIKKIQNWFGVEVILDYFH